MADVREVIARAAAREIDEVVEIIDFGSDNVRVKAAYTNGFAAAKAAAFDHVRSPHFADAILAALAEQGIACVPVDVAGRIEATRREADERRASIRAGARRSRPGFKP